MTWLRGDAHNPRAQIMQASQEGTFGVRAPPAPRAAREPTPLLSRESWACLCHRGQGVWMSRFTSSLSREVADPQEGLRSNYQRNFKMPWTESRLKVKSMERCLFVNTIHRWPRRDMGWDSSGGPLGPDCPPPPSCLPIKSLPCSRLGTNITSKLPLPTSVASFSEIRTSKKTMTETVIICILICLSRETMSSWGGKT